MSKSNSLFNYFKKVETPDAKKTPKEKVKENKENENVDVAMVEEVSATKIDE